MHAVDVAVPADQPPGTITGSGELVVADGVLGLDEVQPAGKRPMPGDAWRAGWARTRPRHADPGRLGVTDVDEEVGATRPLVTSRDIALDVLLRVEGGAFSNVLLPSLLRASTLEDRDRAFTTDLVYGTLRTHTRAR